MTHAMFTSPSIVVHPFYLSISSQCSPSLPLAIAAWQNTAGVGGVGVGGGIAVVGNSSKLAIDDGLVEGNTASLVRALPVCVSLPRVDLPAGCLDTLLRDADVSTPARHM